MDSAWITYSLLVAICLSYTCFHSLKLALIKRKRLIRYNYRLIFFFGIIVVANIFSLDKVVLSEYTNDKDYDWTNFYDVITFPYEQLEIQNNQSSFNNSDYSSFKRSLNFEAIDYHFFMDRTGSMKSGDTSIASLGLESCLAGESRAYLYDNFDGEIGSSISQKTKKDPYTLFGMNLIRSLFHSQENSPDGGQKIRYQYYHYLGDKDSKIQGVAASNNRVVVRDVNLIDQLDVIDTMTTDLRGNHVTNIASIFELVRKKVTKDAQGIKYNKVLIISDFDHDIDNGSLTFDSLRVKINKVGKKLKERIDELILIKVPSKNGSTIRPEKTLEIIQEVFGEKVHEYAFQELIKSRFKEPYFYDILSIAPELETVKNNGREPFSFYTSDRGINKRYNAKISLNSLICADKNPNDEFKHRVMITFKDPKFQNFSQASPYMKIGDKVIQLNGSQYFNGEELNDEDVYISFGELLSDEAYIEISSVHSLTAYKIPIKLHSKLSRLSAFLLLVCYLIITSLLTCNHFIYARTIYFCLKDKYDAFLFSSISNQNDYEINEDTKLYLNVKKETFKISRCFLGVLVFIILLSSMCFFGLIIYYMFGSQFFASFCVVALLVVYIVVFAFGGQAQSNYNLIAIMQNKGEFIVESKNEQNKK